MVLRRRTWVPFSLSLLPRSLGLLGIFGFPDQWQRHTKTNGESTNWISQKSSINIQHDCVPFLADESHPEELCFLAWFSHRSYSSSPQNSWFFFEVHRPCLPNGISELLSTWEATCSHIMVLWTTKTTSFCTICWHAVWACNRSRNDKNMFMSWWLCWLQSSMYGRMSRHMQVNKRDVIAAGNISHPKSCWHSWFQSYISGGTFKQLPLSKDHRMATVNMSQLTVSKIAPRNSTHSQSTHSIFKRGTQHSLLSTWSFLIKLSLRSPYLFFWNFGFFWNLLKKLSASPNRDVCLQHWICTNGCTLSMLALFSPQRWLHWRHAQNERTHIWHNFQTWNSCPDALLPRQLLRSTHHWSIFGPRLQNSSSLQQWRRLLGGLICLFRTRCSSGRNMHNGIHLLPQVLVTFHASSLWWIICHSERKETQPHTIVTKNKNLDRKH